MTFIKLRLGDYLNKVLQRKTVNKVNIIIIKFLLKVTSSINYSYLPKCWIILKNTHIKKSIVNVYLRDVLGKCCKCCKHLAVYFQLALYTVYTVS